MMLKNDAYVKFLLPSGNADVKPLGKSSIHDSIHNHDNKQVIRVNGLKHYAK